jgi:glutamate-1-semialdehyde aminotransferase
MVGAEAARWCKNGSDATEAAARVARHVTGRSKIIVNSYHGVHGDLVYATPGKHGGQAGGDDIIVAPTQADMLANVRGWNGQLAAVLIEPWTPAQGEWTSPELREACDEVGALLVHDEMLTGFRRRAGSWRPDVVPDLACFGKAIANGAPLAALVGKRKYMESLLTDVFMSGTYAAGVSALYACHKALARLDRAGWTRIEEITMRLQEALGELVVGGPGRLQWAPGVEKARVECLANGLAQRGILVGRDWFPQHVHTNDQVEKTLAAIKGVLA